jgi:hypothetical protein
MHNPLTANLRKVADNLDGIADHEALRGHEKLVHVLRNNAAYVRKAALVYLNTEIAMGKFADKIHAVEKDRDAAKAQVLSLQTELAQAQQAQTQLDALTAAGRIADDADLAALSDDPAETTTPTPETPVTPETPA